MMDLKEFIREVPDFPKKGINFKDITTILQNKEAFHFVISQFYEKYKAENVDVVVGIESRGFIFGAVLAHPLGVPFVPIRKEGKLPADTMKEEYSLEYGTAAIEIHKDSITSGQRVVLVDDLLATGGTALASIKLIELLGGTVIGCAFVITLSFLPGKEKLNNYPVFSLVDY